METKTIISFMLMISVLTGCSQPSTVKSGYLLWKISGKDLKNPSYLLGTLHLEPGSYIDSIPGARKALRECEQVVSEIEVSDSWALQAQMQQDMRMTEDTTYRMLYTDDEYNLVNDRLTAVLGVGLEQLAEYKPGAIVLMYSMIMYQKLFPDFNPMNALDYVIQLEAVKENKMVKGLETGAFQADVLLNSGSLKRQAEVLLCNMKDTDYVANQARGLIDDYHNADLDKLYSYMNDPANPCPSTPEEINALLKNRNDDWMTKLPDIMKEHSSFIAVGAMHLAGDVGLLNQLEKAGYTIQAVTK